MSNFIIIRQKIRPFVRGDKGDTEGRRIHERLRKKMPSSEQTRNQL